MTRAAALVLRSLAAVAVSLMTGWAALAVYWSDIQSPALRISLAVGIVLATLWAFALCRRKGRVFAGYLACFILFVFWWSSIAPSNDRDWQRDVAVLPHAEVNGDLVTMHDVRDFSYTTETDYQPRYHDKTYDLSKLDSVDLIAVYWMGDAIAHVMMSFGFGGKDFLCFSIETRKEVGEEYSSLKGFFRQYELTYVAADERDLIRLRTDYRNPPEDVYLYRTRIPKENARKLFLEYVKQINSLYSKPEFYNTLTTNCTTNIIGHVRAFGGKVRYNWKILLSGYTPQYVYELGGLDDTLPFEELRARSHVNPAARAAGDAPDFSARIRAGLPGMGTLKAD
jgi:hypothetical protein